MEVTIVIFEKQMIMISTCFIFENIAFGLFQKLPFSYKTSILHTFPEFSIVSML